MAYYNYRRNLERRAFLWIFFGAIVAFGIVPASAECLNESYELTLESAAKKKLGDGAHVVGTVTTKQGKLEARVVAKNGAVSQPEFYLGDKQLKKVTKEKLPKLALACLSKRSSLSISDRLFAIAGSVSAAIIPPAYAAGRCTARFKTVWSECNAGGCTYVLERTDCGRFVGYYVV